MSSLKCAKKEDHNDICRSIREFWNASHSLLVMHALLFIRSFSFYAAVLAVSPGVLVQWSLVTSPSYAHQMVLERSYAIARPSICLSIRLSVTRVDHTKTVEIRIMKLSLCSSPIPLVFVG